MRGDVLVPEFIGVAERGEVEHVDLVGVATPQRLVNRRHSLLAVEDEQARFRQLRPSLDCADSEVSRAFEQQ